MMTRGPVYVSLSLRGLGCALGSPSAHPVEPLRLPLERADVWLPSMGMVLFLMQMIFSLLLHSKRDACMRMGLEIDSLCTE